MIDRLIDVRAFDPHAASAAAWAEYHAHRRARAVEEDPGEPVLGDAEFEHSVRRAGPLQESHRLTAHLAGRLAGNIGFSVRREGTPDYAEFAPFVWAWGGVLQPWRRRSVATALLRGVLAFMRDHGNATLSCGTHQPEGHAFLAAIGAVEKLRTVENRLDFAGLDWPALASWETAALPPGGKLRREVHAGRVPMARLASLMPQLGALFGDVPLGAMDVPPQRYELPAYTSWYEEMDRRGGEHFLVLLAEGDTIAAMCEASWDARFPERAYQMLTAVARPWRGRGLAKGAKAAMLRLLRERHPGMRLLMTWNAEVNAAMLAINRRLGCTAHRHDSTYQIGREALAAWLAGRG